MNASSSTFRIYGLIVLCAALVIAVYVWPAHARRAELGARIEESRGRVAQIPAVRGELEQMRATLERLRGTAAQTLKQIPDSPNQFALLDALGPKNSDIVIQEQTFARAVEANGASCMSLPVNLELVGGFADIFDLVRRIETLPRLVVIREMDLSSAEETGNGRVSANLGLDVIYARASGYSQPE